MNQEETLLEILKKIAEKSDGRTDKKILIADIYPNISAQVFVGGKKFVDKDDPKYDSGSKLSYYLNTLEEKGLIQHCYLKQSQGKYGSPLYSDPGILLRACLLIDQIGQKEYRTLL